MFLQKLHKRLTHQEEQNQLQPAILNLPEVKASFATELTNWVNEYKDENAILLLDSETLTFLRAHCINFDYNSTSLVVVWDNCIVIGNTYAVDGKYAVLKEFITTYPKHEIVYKNDKSVAPKVYILHLEQNVLE